MALIYSTYIQLKIKRRWLVRFMVFNATFNNISIISWRLSEAEIIYTLKLMS
jgi:hypothetical protein